MKTKDTILHGLCGDGNDIRDTQVYGVLLVKSHYVIFSLANVLVFARNVRRGAVDLLLRR